MCKRDNSRQPTTTKAGREVSSTDEVIGTPKSIELSALEFEGEPIEFISENGERWYTGYAVGKIVGFEYKHVTELYRRKREIFDDTADSRTVRLSGKMQSAEYERGRLYGEWGALRSAWDIIEHSEKKHEMLKKMLPLIEKSNADSRKEREAYLKFIDACQAEVDRFRTEKIIERYSDGFIRSVGEV